MKKYIIRLDDASEYRNKEKWDRMEKILDKYGIKPLVGVIPHCREKILMDEGFHDDLWEKVSNWEAKEWIIAMHGYTHELQDKEKNIHEFKDLTYEKASMKILKAKDIFEKHNVFPNVFFPPGNQLNRNTIRALQDYTSIRVISNGYARQAYESMGMTFVPVQTGTVKYMPYYKMITFVYHPNTMSEEEFDELCAFLEKNKESFIPFPVERTKRKKNALDIVTEKMLKKYRQLRIGKER